MKIVFDILRRRSVGDAPYHQRIRYETENLSETVATALQTINDSGDYRDERGQVVEEIRWECSCLQKKCGACAMVINGRPRLACDSFLKDYSKKGIIRLTPLTKFPVVADLIVDRSIMFENLKTMQLWSSQDIAVKEADCDSDFEASRCLQCGCCLEVCPNFCVGGTFAGAAAFVPTARFLNSLDGAERARIEKEYRRHVYEGCGKSLSCRDICPAGIDTENLLVRSNALGVWRRRVSGDGSS